MDPRANAEIEGNVIRLGRYISDVAREHPETFVLGHEWTHRMQQTARSEYGRFVEAIRPEIQEEAAWLQDYYARNGVTLDEAGAIDEAAANYAGDLLENGELLDRFIEDHRGDRTLLQRLWEGIKRIVDRLTGQARRYAESAEGRLRAALDAAAENVRESENAAPEGGEVRYSISQTEDGKKYVRADRQVIFGNNPTSWGEQVENYINGKIRRGEDVRLFTENGDILTLSRTSAAKLSTRYDGKGKALSDGLYETKLNAATHIDELAEISSRGRTRQDDGGIHGDFANRGFNYRTAYFQDFDGKTYRLDISVAQGNKGDVIYNIGNIRERSLSAAQNASPGSSGNAGAQSSQASNRSVTQDESESNPRYINMYACSSPGWPAVSFSNPQRSQAAAGGPAAGLRGGTGR